MKTVVQLITVLTMLTYVALCVLAERLVTWTMLTEMPPGYELLTAGPFQYGMKEPGYDFISGEFWSPVIVRLFAWSRIPSPPKNWQPVDPPAQVKEYHTVSSGEPAPMPVIHVDKSKDPPPGFKIIKSEEGRYTFVDSNGSTNMFTRGSVEDALFCAWSAYGPQGHGDPDMQSYPPEQHTWMEVK